MSRRTALYTIAGCAALAVAHAFYYFPFLSDDALISLRYVERLLGGHGLTWTDGPRVEGYSNLLWILLTAGLAACKVDPIAAVRALGVVSSVAVAGAIVFTVRRRAHAVALALAGCLVWAASGTVAAWTLGGLEMPLVAACLAWAIALAFTLHRDSLRTGRARGGALALGICLGGLVLTRPDGVLFAIVVVGWLAVHARSVTGARAALVRAAAVPAACVAAQLAFRLAYYGDWVPNTAYVKLDPSLHTMREGLRYARGGLGALLPLAPLAGGMLVTLCACRRRRREASLVTAVAVAWLAWIVLAGGDYFTAWRLFVPVVVAVAFTAVLAAGWIAEALSPRWRVRAVTVVGVVLVWFVVVQFRDPKHRSAKLELWEWNGKAVGTVLGRGFHDAQPLLAVTTAGAIPYWSRLPCLDLLGLNDRHIARAVVANSERGAIGHRKGDIAYVLGRAPDLMHFGPPGGGDPVLAYAPMRDSPAFLQHYDRSNFASKVEGGWFIARMWTRRSSPTIGIREYPDSVIVPPYLLNISGSAVARLDDSGRFYVIVSSRDPAGVRRLRLGAGRWQMHAPGAPAVCLVRDSATELPLVVQPVAPPSFTVEEPGLYDVLIVAGPEPATVRRLVLQRLR